MGYHADLAQKRRAEKSAQRWIDADELRRREDKAYQTAVRKAEEAARLAEHLHDMVQVDPENVFAPSGTGHIGVELPVLKVWTRPPHLRRVKFSCGNVLEMWHGTKHTSLAAIAKEGLRRGRESCLFGSGIYLSRDISKALNYARGCTANGAKAVTLLRCAVATGVHLNAHSEPWRSALDSGSVGPTGRYNSVWAPGMVPITGAFNGSLLHEEWVVYSPLQVEVLEVYFWTEPAKPIVVAKPAAVVADPPPKPAVKQRIGTRDVIYQRKMGKERASRQEQIAKQHLCVTSDGVCRFADMRCEMNSVGGKVFLPICVRFDNKVVSPFPVSPFNRLRSNVVPKLCSHFMLK